MTIAGQHTITETQDLINSYQGLIDQMNSKYQALPAGPDKDGMASDWQAFLSRWNSAKTTARAKLIAVGAITPLASNTVIPAEGIYTDILKALKQDYPGPYKKGDYDDLAIRLTTALTNAGHAPINYSKFVQVATEAADLDLAALKTVEGGIDSAEGFGTRITESAFTPKNIAIAAVGGAALLFIYKKL